MLDNKTLADMLAQSRLNQKLSIHRLMLFEKLEYVTEDATMSDKDNTPPSKHIVDAIGRIKYGAVEVLIHDSRCRAGRENRRKPGLSLPARAKQHYSCPLEALPI